VLRRWQSCGEKAGPPLLRVNRWLVDANPDRGYKQSGMGREMGMHAVNLYTEVKNIYFSSE